MGGGTAKTISAGDRTDPEQNFITVEGGKKHITPIIPNSAEQINTIDTRVGAGTHWSPYIDDTPVEIKRPHGYFPGSAKEVDAISTIDSSIDYQHIVIGEKKLIKNATEQGYLEGEAGDGVDISSRMEYHRGTVQKEKTQTLTTMGGGEPRGNREK